MKKLFTLLSVAVLSASAFAMGPFARTQSRIVGMNSPEKIQNLLVSRDALSHNGGEVIGKKSWTQGNYVYDLTIMNRGVLVDELGLMIGDKDAPGGSRLATFADLPFFMVSLELERTKKGETKADTDVFCLLTWPSQQFIKNPDLNAKFDENDRVIVPLDQMAEGNALSNSFIYPGYETDGKPNMYNLFPLFWEGGGLAFWPIISPAVDASSLFNGSEVDLVTPDIQSQASIFTIEAYDAADDNNITLPFEFYFSNGASMDGTYQGASAVNKMVVKDYNTKFTDFHIFNAGIFDGDEDANYDVFPYPFGYPDVQDLQTLNQWYVAASCGNLQVGISKGETVTFDSSRIGFFRPSEDYVPTAADWRFFEGYFWTKGEEYGNRTLDYKPFGLTQPVGFDTYVTMVSPEDNIFISGSYSSDWSKIYGSRLAWDAFYTPIEAPSYYAFNTAEGVEFHLTDNTAQHFTLTVDKGYYHPDPEDMTVTEEVDFKGSYVPQPAAVQFVADENAYIGAANGYINVKAENAAPVAVYNMSGAVVAKAAVAAGETVSLPVAKGVYVVKVGKTAKKVAL